MTERPNRVRFIPRVLLLPLLLVVLLAACSGATTPTQTPAATQDPLALLTEAAANIRAVESLRLTVDVTGPEYTIGTDYGNVVLRRVTAQFAPPGTMQADVRVAALGLTLDVDVFARGEDQWFRAIWTGDQWLNQPFAVGFNPEALIGQETGFQAAIDSVRELVDQGETNLETGQRVRHLSGLADGGAMNALLIGLIEMQGEVAVDVYLDVETNLPARFVLVETVPVIGSAGFLAAATLTAGEGTAEAGAETGAETGVETTGEPAPEVTQMVTVAEPVPMDTDEPRVWTLDIFDINAPTEFEIPSAEGTAEAAVPAESAPAEATGSEATSPFLGAGG